MSAPLASDQLNGSPRRVPPATFGFLQPEEPPTTAAGTIPNPATSPETTEELPGGGSGSAAAWDDASDLDESGETSGLGSSPASEKVANPLNGAGIRDVITNALIIGGDQAHRFLARTPGQKDVGLYAMERHEAEPIADPLARIAQRHEGVGQVSPDTADLLSAMTALAAYGSRQVQKAATAKKLDARHSGHEGPQTLPTDEELAGL